MSHVTPEHSGARDVLSGGENDRNKAEQGVHGLAGNSPAEAPRAQQPPSQKAIEWRKKFIDACPPFVPEAQRQAYEILLDSYFQAAIDAAKEEVKGWLRLEERENAKLREQLRESRPARYTKEEREEIERLTMKDFPPAESRPTKDI
jgi:hypothetical protein